MPPIQVKYAGNFLRLCKRIDIQSSAFFHQNFRRATSETFYDVLGVPQDAKDTEIRKAFIELSKKLHPDANPSDKSLHDKFVKINDAYNILSDPTERKIYDYNLKQGFHMGAHEVPTSQNWNPEHPQYYYHPKFYKDPRMRKEAAKAWTQNCGPYFNEYMKDDYKDPKDIPREERQFDRVSVILMLSMLAIVVYNLFFLSRRRRSQYSEDEMKQMAKGYHEALIDDPNGSGKQVKVKYVNTPPQGRSVSYVSGTAVNVNRDDSLATKL